MKAISPLDSMSHLFGILGFVQINSLFSLIGKMWQVLEILLLLIIVC